MRSAARWVDGSRLPTSRPGTECGKEGGARHSFASLLDRESGGSIIVFVGITDVTAIAAIAISLVSLTVSWRALNSTAVSLKAAFRPGDLQGETALAITNDGHRRITILNVELRQSGTRVQRSQFTVLSPRATEIVQLYGMKPRAGDRYTITYAPSSAAGGYFPWLKRTWSDTVLLLPQAPTDSAEM